MKTKREHLTWEDPPRWQVGDSLLRIERRDLDIVTVRRWDSLRCRYGKWFTQYHISHLHPETRFIKAYLERWTRLAQMYRKKKAYRQARKCEENAARCVAIILNPDTV